MSRQVSVDNSAVGNLIRQAYQAGGKFQWVRESLVNSIQAEATWVKFGIEESGYESQGVLRRYVADNGHGMNEDELGDFLSHFGSGGREISDHGNFGQGFKASCYLWNPYGIVVLSWTKGTPDGRMIWIHKRVRNGTEYWELKDFESYDEVGDPFVSDCIPPTREALFEIGVDPDRLMFEQIREAGQGTVFLFLGDSASRNTQGGDFLRQEEQQSRGILRYINMRFVELPDDVDIRVENLEKHVRSAERRGSKDNFYLGPDGKTTVGVHSRTPKGIKGMIPDGAVKGVLENGPYDTKFHWYLSPSDAKPVKGGDGPTRPVIAILYQGEAYSLLQTTSDFRSFGLPKAVRDRVWLTIEPPESIEGDETTWGVKPQGSRNQLIVSGGGTLPWAEWRDWFSDSLPDAITNAILLSDNSVPNPEDLEQEEALRRTMSRFSQRFRPIHIVENPNGNVRASGQISSTGSPESLGGSRPPGEDSETHSGANEATGGQGDRAVLSESIDGDKTGVRRAKSDGIPKVSWDDDFPFEDRFLAAKFEPNERFRTNNGGTGKGVLHLNLYFPLFQNEFKYWQEQYGHAPYEEVMEIVKSAYESEAVSKVMHAKKLNGARTISPEALEEAESPVDLRISQTVVNAWLGPEALTAALLGLVNVESRIVNRFNGRHYIRTGG